VVIDPKATDGKTRTGEHFPVKTVAVGLDPDSFAALGAQRRAEEPQSLAEAGADDDAVG
jgi:hypothetical protein